ncbi:ly6/PLAUR domain-containing protein 6B-like isoform X2 [Daphnia carinata]|uniref:ly6/PLAUR domain-containing protein 6B-like isoform X2 n=1 Tax=Daphnia carinata TaxID=120202 RepID=UPI00257BC459|nr:ly6/PLAUR domain-containing protein 6B-like isoform X2 [Daphnia carinata]
MDHWAISSTMATVFALAALTAMPGSAQMMSIEEDRFGHLFDIDSASDEMACYYCVNVTSNDICNRFAIERPCPTDLSVCHTHHVMDGRGKTLAVTKTCATPQTCFSQVGCRRDKSTNQTVCVNCCDLHYCNEEVAFNASTAIFHRSNDDGTAAFSSATHALTGTALILGLFFLFSSLT